MPSIIRKPSRWGKDSNAMQPALPREGSSERRTDFKMRLQLMLSSLAMVSCLLLVAYTRDVMVTELCKALALVAGLNMFRIMSNSNSSTEK